MTRSRPGYWNQRRVIVTGGAGFLGQHVVKKLLPQGANVLVVRSAQYDLRQDENVRRLFQDFPCQTLIHLAARVGGIGANRANPGSYFYDNLIMGALLMEHARRAGVNKFVQIGTVCSYPKITPIPFHESALWDGYPEETNAPYGLAKKALLVQAQAYRAQYGFDAIYLLPANLYGPHDNFDLGSSHVIPAIIRKCLDAKVARQPTAVLWGNGQSTRQFLYVEDAADAIILASELYAKTDPVNLGSTLEISIKDLAEIIRKLCQFPGTFIWDTTQPNGQPRRSLDTSRAQEEFGWTAKIPLEDGLSQTIRWYLQKIGE